MIVVDASVILDVLLRSGHAVSIEKRLFRSDTTLHAPHLIDLEVAQVVRRYLFAGELNPSRGAEVLRDLVDLPIERYPHWPFLSEIWSLRDQLTAYDAAYVVLARTLGAPLVTRDRRLSRTSLPGVEFEII